jgi:hypothetical protein
MFGRGICEKYQSRDEKFPEPKGESVFSVKMENYLTKKIRRKIKKT